MEAALWVAKTGLDAQQTRMTVIANNLANVNTTGFKRDRATFEDLIGDLDGTVRRILATVSAEAAEIPAPQTKQQSDSSSRDWIDRFLAERPQHRHRAGG